MLRKSQICISCMAVQTEILRKHVVYTKNPSHKLFTKLHQRLSRSRSFALVASDRGRSSSVRTPRYGSARIEKIGRRSQVAEPVWEELQVLRMSAFPFSVEFFMKNHFTHTTSSECKPSLLMTIVQEWYFDNGSLQNAYLIPQAVANILFTGEVGLARDGAVNFRSTHVWTDDSFHTTVASRYQH
jgi:hypothetical protein